MFCGFDSSNFFKKLSYLFTSVLGVGFIPIAPGTFGSMFGVLIYILLKNTNYCSFYIFLAIAISTLISFPTIKCVLKHPIKSFKKEKDLYDPSHIVIDEVIGQLVTILLVSQFCTLDLYYIFMCFFCFRVFDVLKPWPIFRVEQIFSKNEKLKWLGIILDDVVAGLFSGLILSFIAMIGIWK